MTKGLSAQHGRKPAAARDRKAVPPAAGEPGGIVYGPPLEPQKPLFLFMCVVVAAWVVFLLVLYFKTVYPGHSVPSAPRPGEGVDLRSGR